MTATAGTVSGFQSTLPVWGATFIEILKVIDEYISIHAPRVGSDAKSTADAAAPKEFQSTLPVWGATNTTMLQGFAGVFQSTLPVWGATVKKRIFYSNFQFFSV